MTAPCLRPFLPWEMTASLLHTHRQEKPTNPDPLGLSVDKVLLSLAETFFIRNALARI